LLAAVVVAVVDDFCSVFFAAFLFFLLLLLLLLLLVSVSARERERRTDGRTDRRTWVFVRTKRKLGVVAHFSSFSLWRTFSCTSPGGTSSKR
jgi:membrane protein implicated in regulation of membrane protease activity